MVTEKGYQDWLKRNKGMNEADCLEMLNNAYIQYINNPNCKVARGVYQSALYCTSRYQEEEGLD